MKFIEWIQAEGHNINAALTVGHMVAYEAAVIAQAVESGAEAVADAGLPAAVTQAAHAGAERAGEIAAAASAIKTQIDALSEQLAALTGGAVPPIAG